MPRIKCISAYSSSRGGTWAVGHEDDVSDAIATFLLNDSPGSFELVKAVAAAATSAETATGMTVPDRRARGGRRRKS